MPRRSAEPTLVRPSPAGAHVRAEPTVERPSRLGRLADTHRTVVLAVVTTYLALVTVVPVATTPDRSDDKVNRDLPGRFDESGLGFVQFVSEWIGPWIEREGRFFPGSAVWTFVVFTVFQSREPYKIFLAALVLTMVVLCCVVVVTLTRSQLAPVVVVGLTSTLTLRYFFDGLDTFSGILPLTVCLTLGSLLLLLRGRGWPTALCAALLWSYVLVTYEVAILLGPTLCLLVWRRRALTRTLPLVVPAASVAVLSVVLRSQAEGSTGNAYRINLEPWRVLVTYVKQAAAALPLSEQWFPGGVGLDVDRTLLGLMVLLVGGPAAVALVVLARDRLTVSTGSLWLTATLGASMWLLPPVLVAVSLGWQNELPRGQGYVSVVWGYVGVAVLLATGWTALARATGRGRSPARTLALHSLTAVLAMSAAATVAQSVTVAALVNAPGSPW